METTTQSTPRDSDILNELVSRVTHWFDSLNSPYGLKNHQRNSSHGWRMDSTAQTAPRDSHVINETATMDDAWLRQPKQPVGT